MKNASLPSVRVEPELRAHLESALYAGESLSQFVETAVRQVLQQRTQQADFVARGLASLAAARQGGDQVDAEVVLRKLEQRLARAKTKLARSEQSARSTQSAQSAQSARSGRRA